jgi:hypothetical protein
MSQFKCLTCGKIISPQKGKLKCCGYTAKVEDVRPMLVTYGKGNVGTIDEALRPMLRSIYEKHHGVDSSFDSGWDDE